MQGRTPRTRGALARLIDGSVLREARATLAPTTPAAFAATPPRAGMNNVEGNQSVTTLSGLFAKVQGRLRSRSILPALLPIIGLESK